jgi:diguanylate cyclase (GGDEF)-like protein
VFLLFPICGATAVGIGALADVHRSQERTGRVQQSVGQYVRLSTLRNALNDEKYFVGASQAIKDLGVDPAFVRSVTGIDVNGQANVARATVDGLSGYAGESFPDELRRARNTRSGDLVRRLDGYDVLESDLALRSQRLFEEILADVREVGGSDLTSRLQVLEAATVARQTASAQLTDYFTIRFAGGPDTGSALQSLVAHRALYRSALDEIDRLAGDGSLSAGRMAEIRSSADQEKFDESVSDLLRSAFERGWTPDVPGALRGDLAGAAGAYQAGAKSVEAHVGLIDRAGEDVDATIAALVTKQSGEAQDTLLLIVATAATSVLFVIALGRTFDEPLRRLAEQARAIGDGEFLTLVEPSGPAEVRKATLALHDAAEHLQLVEDQALALARGDLDGAVLHRLAAGALGASLQEAVRTLAASVAESEEFRRRLAHEAAHDGLTQLANRNSTLDQLARSLDDAGRTGAQVAVLFIDLDGFKDVNDEYGHHAGDAVLQAIAQRLATRVRPQDSVGRLGGDEFLVIARRVDGPADALQLAHRLLEAMEQPIPFGSCDLQVSGSIGVALTTGLATTADELLRDADMAAYHAKASGRACVRLFTEELRASTAAQAHHEHAIRRAIANDEFQMHFQPVVDVQSRRVSSFESLVRWDRPGHGLLLPGDFVPFAERSELVVDLDRWVLRAVAFQLAAWSSHPTLRNAPIAVNVSGRSLGSAAFVDDVLGPLRTLGVDPSKLIVEITEGALPEDLTAAAQKLAALRACRVRIAIDDFGTGFTSLAHLKTLPVDLLKIDRSFTNDTGSESLVKLIIDTGHLLGARIVAEGVETAEQAERLASLGADALQGYLFGRPAPPAEVEAKVSPSPATTPAAGSANAGPSAA